MEEARRAIMMNLRKRGNIYLTAMRPAPYTNYQIYKELLTPDERVAIKLLASRMPDIMSLRQYAYITLNSKEAIKLEFDREIPLPTTAGPMFPNSKAYEFRLRQLPSDMQSALREWSREYIQTRDKLEEIYAYAEKVMKPCNTIGHISRVWPSLVLFMNSFNKDQRAMSKVKSPYPNGVMRPAGEGQWEVDPEYAKGHLYDETLAAMLVFSSEMPANQPVYVVNNQ